VVLSNDFQASGNTDAVACYVSFAQITCSDFLTLNSLVYM